MYYAHSDHLGSFVTITDATGTIKQKCSFCRRVTSDPWFMHEYEHYIQSQHWGPLYLIGVGIPSARAANKSHISVPNDPIYCRTMDDIAPIEMRANRRAAKYFGDKYNVNWDYNGDLYYYKFPLYYHPNRTTIPGPVKRRHPYRW